MERYLTQFNPSLNQLQQNLVISRQKLKQFKKELRQVKYPCGVGVRYFRLIKCYLVHVVM